MTQYNEIIQKLKLLANPDNVAGMARFGINSDKTFGIKIPDLRKIAKQIGKDPNVAKAPLGKHALALDLWNSGYHETRILASMIDDPKLVDEKQMDSWVADFDSWDVCDQTAMNLFWLTPFAYDKAVEWSSHQEEFIKRAGFAMMSVLAWKDKQAKDEQLLKFLPIIKREATDNRNFVKKAVNWALRQIGKRNSNLNKNAIETAKEIQLIGNKAAKWIANDALKELQGEAVQKRLGNC